MNTNTDQRVKELEAQVGRLSQCVAYLAMAQGYSSQHRVRSLVRGISIEPQLMVTVDDIAGKTTVVVKKGKVLGNRKAG